MEAVQTAVNICGAVWAFIGTRDRAFELYLLFAMMAEHGRRRFLKLN
jgi:hypothetical protein